MSNIINKKVTINVNDVFTQEVMDNMHDAALFAMEYAKENGKDILDLFDIVSLKKHKIKVKLNDEKTKDDIISWQALIKEDYPELKMNMIKLKEKDTYKIEISKIE